MADNFTLSNHFKQRCNELNEYERERHEILSQCGKCANPLYADFRYDEICFALEKLKAKGIKLAALFNFQENVHNVIYPWNTEYNTLRQDVNRRFNVFPLIIVMAKTEQDVIDAYHFANTYNIEISLRSGAHSFEGFSLGEGMIIDQSNRKNVEICLKRRIIKIQPGALIGPLVDQLSKYGLTFPIGSCPNNGIAGYCLGSGIGSLIRMYGTGSDNILEAKILLANGKIVIVNKDHYSDLFWAIRGAGIGNFGIVLSLTLKVYPLKDVYIFSLSYEFKNIREVITTWFRWIQSNPIELTADFHAFNNRKSVSISGLYLKDDEEELKRLLKPLHIGKTTIKINKVPYVEAVKINSGKGRWQPFFKFKNAFVEKTFPSKALDIIEDFLSIGDGSDYLIVDNLGGLNDCISPNDSAFVHRNLLGWLHINAQWDNEKDMSEKIKWATDFYEQLSPYLSFEVYQNTPDLNITNYLQRYYGENLPRLVEIKKKYDPENVFHYPQSIPVEL
jgi:FAD/FMN-containing dehydrogenase